MKLFKKQVSNSGKPNLSLGGDWAYSRRTIVVEVFNPVALATHHQLKVHVVLGI